MLNSIVLDLSHGPGNPRNSEGAFATLKDGRILFVHTRYYGGSWADEATADLCSRISEDGGRTWSKRGVVVVENEGKRNVMSVSLLRLQDGRLALFYLRKNSVMDCRPYLRISTDEGGTWGKPNLCIAAPGYFCVNNDRVIQLKGGRLVMPAGFHRNRNIPPKGGKMTYDPLDFRGIAMFYLSDDAGKTWREARDWWALPVRSGSGLQEPGVVELSDGRLYAYCRTDVGCHYEMFSEDGGETWSAPRPSVFRAPCSPLCIKRIPSTGHLLAVWNDHSGRQGKRRPEYDKMSWGRTPLVAAVSLDDGRTWSKGRVIESDPQRGFCYTAIHFAGDAVLLAYCCGGGGKSGVLQDLCVRRVDLNWLTSC